MLAVIKRYHKVDQRKTKVTMEACTDKEEEGIYHLPTYIEQVWTYEDLNDALDKFMEVAPKPDSIRVE